MGKGGCLSLRLDGGAKLRNAQQCYPIAHLVHVLLLDSEIGREGLNMSSAKIDTVTGLTGSDNAYAYAVPKAAAFLNVAPKTLANWRTMGKGPKFCRIGRRIVYRVDDLRRFMDEHLFDPDEREGWLRR
jgi:hypothetical protein